MFAPSWLFLFRRWAPLAADGSVGKGKKDQAARDTGKQIACARSGCARTRSPMCRIRHPGINAPSAFTNPDKEGCGNNKPRGKCLQTPKGVELFPPLSLVLFLRHVVRSSLLLSLNPCFSPASTNSGAVLSLFCSLPDGVESHLIHHGNFAPREHPFPFNFHYQVHTRFPTCVSSPRITRPFCAISRQRYQVPPKRERERERERERKRERENVALEVHTFPGSKVPSRDTFIHCIVMKLPLFIPLSLDPTS